MKTIKILAGVVVLAWAGWNVYGAPAASGGGAGGGPNAASPTGPGAVAPMPAATPSAGPNGGTGSMASPGGTAAHAPGMPNSTQPGGPVNGTYPNYSASPGQSGGTNGMGIPNIPPTR